MVKNILITGAGGNASIGFCRCLHRFRRNYRLIGTDIDPYKILFSEVDRRFLVPRVDTKEYLDVLNTIIVKNKIAFLHAQPDVEIAYLAKTRNKLKAKTFLPRTSAIEIAQDKLTTQKILEKNKLPVPVSLHIKNETDIKNAFKVLKSPIWFRSSKGAGGKGSLLIKNKEMAFAWINYWDGFGNFMACQYLPGKNIGWDSIWLDGRLITSHTKERLSYALSGSIPSGISGTAGIIRSVKRKEIDEIASSAVLAVDEKPQGVFSVDLKEDKEGNPFVTEINPGRFLTSSLHFFAETGFNLPAVFVKTALNEKLDIPLRYPEGFYMIRSLDAKPILITEKSIQKIIKRKKENGYSEVKLNFKQVIK